MLRAILLPLLAVAGGVGGLFLRRWELDTVFDHSGLAAPGAPASIALIALSVGITAAFALLCRGRHNHLDGYGSAFHAQGNWLYLALTAVASAHLLLSGIFSLMAFFRGNGLVPISQLFLALLCLASFVSVLVISVNNFRGDARSKCGFTLLVPAYLYCLWLAVAYQQRASDPVLLNYVYELLAIMSALLGLYFTAGFAFERAKVWRCSFFCLMSIYFSLVTLADSHDQSTALLLRFTVLYQLAAVFPLLYNAFSITPQQRLDGGAQEVITNE